MTDASPDLPEPNAPPYNERRVSMDFKRMDDLKLLANHIAVNVSDQIKTEIGVPPAVHQAHHEYVKICIEEKKQREAIKQKLIESLINYGILGALGVLSVALWEYVKQRINGV